MSGSLHPSINPLLRIIKIGWNSNRWNWSQQSFFIHSLTHSQFFFPTSASKFISSLQKGVLCVTLTVIVTMSSKLIVLCEIVSIASESYIVNCLVPLRVLHLGFYLFNYAPSISFLKNLRVNISRIRELKCSLNCTISLNFSLNVLRLCFVSFKALNVLTCLKKP